MIMVCPLLLGVRGLGIRVEVLGPVLLGVTWYLLFNDLRLKNFLALSSNPLSKLLKQIPLLRFDLFGAPMRRGTI